MTVTSLFGWRKALVVALVGVAMLVASSVVSSEAEAKKARGFDGYQNRAQSFNGYQNSGSQNSDSGYGSQTLVASYYGNELAGNPTASGQIFNPLGLTAAHKTLPFGTQLLVSYGGRSVTVTVNDRGPFVGGRDLDLSLGAAQAIGLTGAGVAPVQVTILN